MATRPQPSASAFNKGILRTIRGSLKRFIALATITALGVTMLTGLRAACEDLRASADAFFDDQNLFDIRVQSTLGLTDDDVEALAALEGVEAAEGGYTETVYTQVGSGSEKVDVVSISPSGINAPLVVEGSLPETDDQIAVTERFLEDAGLSLGDTITFHGADDDDDDSAIFERTEYTITAVVLNPLDVNAGDGTMSFRSSGSAQYTFFLLPTCATSEAYTVIYLQVEGADEPLCYSDEYEEIVDDVKQRVEEARGEREIARGEGLRADATAEIDEAEEDALSQLDEAEAEIDDAQAEIDDGLAELESAEDEIKTGRAQVTAGLTELATELGCDVDEIPTAIASARAEIDDGRTELTSARAELEASVDTLSSLSYISDVWPTDAWARLASATDVTTAEEAAAEVSAAIDPFVAQSVSALDELTATVTAYEVAYGDMDAEQQATVDAIIERLPASLQSTTRAIISQPPSTSVEQLARMSGMIAQLSALAPGMVEIVSGEVALDEAASQLDEAEAAYETLLDTSAQLDEAASEIEASCTTLTEAQSEVDEARATLEEERADAESEIADARAEVDEISDATWYVQDRSSLSSYASVDSDASSIEAIGTVIPVVFFVVAVLISLTTMTRMVEEERGLIGVYKALGYRRGRILSKYALYALAACLVGGVAGSVLGFVILPAVIFTIFQTMYALPSLSFGFDAPLAIGATALFAVGIVGATVLSCLQTLRAMPAELMRPKAPRAGSRILLEHIGPLWRRFGFLNKVTARNLFRYKRRFFMTVFGIAGCVALLITGFGIRDTVISLSSRQYGDESVSRYDLMVVTSTDDLPDVADELAASDEVSDLIEVYVDSLTVTYDGSKESVQLIVVPDGTDLTAYISLAREDGSAIELPDEGAVITINAAQILGFDRGDTVELQDSTLAEGSASVAEITVNYLSNTVYLSASAYEQLFGTACEANGVLANLNGSSAEQIAFSEELTRDGRMLTVVSTEELVEDFSSSFTLINTVVYVVIVLAAALSFTVVFTLSNTNISERERELATIKVLGFRVREVHRYINKETLLLTGIGVVAGLPIGYALARSLTWILKMPSIYFDVVVDPATYVIAAALAFAFTISVNQLTNRVLDRVNMVEALKSAE